MDLAVLYAAGRYTALLDYIDMLPRACRFKEAMANDPELAKILAAQPDSTEPWAPEVHEVTLTNMILALIADRLSLVQNTQVAVAGKKPAEFKPFPTPRTAIDRAKEAHEQQFVSEVLGLFGYEPGDF